MASQGYWKSGAVDSPPDTSTLTSKGYPTSGDPKTGTPATKPGAAWYYLQDQMRNSVIDAAGMALASKVLKAKVQMILGTVQIADLAIVLFQILGPMIMLLRLSEMLRIVKNQFGNKLQVQEVVEMHRKLLVVQIQTLLLPQEMVDQLDLLLKDKTIV